SNRIKELEARLGVRLLNRTTRKLTPTDAGRLFHEHACRVIAELEEAEAMVAGLSGNPKGALRVSAPLGTGRRLIAPLVPEFCDLYPEVEIRLRLTDRHINLVEDQLDMAFFLGQPQDSSLKWRKIADCKRVLVASPDYVARVGAPERPDDLQHHKCLLLRFPRSPEYFWMLETPEGPRKMMVRGRFDADETDVLTDWALAGKGIVMRPRFDVAAHLAAGRLVEILPATPPMPAQFGCLYPHRRLPDPKLRMFLDFVAERLRGRF
ncbi:MAG: LysR substrate-binding domain-containing protein, partial [Paracoccus sp. (in: a-proteobacteria)]